MTRFQDIFFEQLETVEVEYCHELSEAFNNQLFEEGYNEVMEDVKDMVMTEDVKDIEELDYRVNMFDAAVEAPGSGVHANEGAERACSILLEVIANMYYMKD